MDSLNNDSWMGERRIIPMLCVMLFFSIALKIFGFRRVCRFAHRSTDKNVKSCSDPQLAMAENAASILRRVNLDYSVFGNSCLAESLALWWLLRRKGIDANLKIGVRTLTGVFESHAWVECAGRVLNEAADIEKIFSTIDLHPAAM